MRNLYRKHSTYRQTDFPSHHGNLIAASLVATILVSCGAKVTEDQTVEEVEVGNQAANAQLQPDTANPNYPPPTQIIQSPQDTDLALSDLPTPPGRPSQVVSENFFRTAERERQLQEPQSVSVRNSDSATTGLNRRVVEQRTVSAEAYSAQPRLQHPVLHTGPMTNRENYLDIDENTVQLVTEHPVSTFSIDVDTAGYSNVRRMIAKEGRLPPHDAVRLEEMINYFSYDYPVPDNIDEPLAIHTELAASPWNSANKLLMVGIQGFEPDLKTRPAANLVFLVDVSGSMNSPDKLGLVQRSLKLLVDQMRDSDRIALVVYAGAAGMVLDSTSGTEKYKIKHAINSLRAGGSTNGAAGIQLAYQIAEQHKIKGGINRVIIASDGDLNVGMTDIDDLKKLISKKRDNGIALTTLGFGTGNYNYSLMEQIADVGNGNAAYIDSLNEARKVLVEEMQSTLLTIAKDVKIQIEFNPAMVKEYRLLGYENRLLNREDFVNDKVDAGEIGAGHTVTALYELTLTNSTGGLIPDRRYNRVTRLLDEDVAGELAYVKIRHKPADGDTSTESGGPVVLSDDRGASETSDSFRFAAAVAGFGQLLRGGKYTGNFNYDQVLELARGARGADNNGYRSELLNLVEMAKLL